VLGEALRVRVGHEARPKKPEADAHDSTRPFLVARPSRRAGRRHAGRRRRSRPNMPPGREIALDPDRSRVGA
jgi:hypothetical protein